MPRAEVNRTAEMEAFTLVVERGGFSAAARALKVTPSAVSKLMGRLETRLGTRLLNRSTRRLQLTEEGELFYQRALKVLGDIDEAEREASAGATPRGRVRINVNIAFGHQCLLPRLAAFRERYPEVTLDITLTDQVVDLLEARADVAIRTGPLPPSQLMARKLGESRLVIVGSPDYLARRGEPRRVQDLQRHDLLGFNFARTLGDGWPLMQEGEPTQVPIDAKIRFGDGVSMRLAALNGLGLARLARFHVGMDIARGDLKPVLEAFNPGDVQPVHAVFLGQSGPVPARVRAFIDFLAREVRIG